MASTIQRLTMYALISALEGDLRDFLLLHVAPIISPTKLLPETLSKKAAERFSKDNPDTAPDADELLEYLDLGEEIQAIRSHDNRLDDVTKKYIKKYYLGIEGVIPVRNRVMHSRPLEFDDLPRISDLAGELVASHRALWANLRTTLRDLERNPDFVTTLNIPDTLDEKINVLHNLPQVEFDDTGFVGREKELADLKQALRGSYPVVTVVGEGGLGKTALALKACYDLLDDERSGLDAIVWTTAKATKLTVSKIQVIEGAISSSFGIIDRAASLLGRQSESSAMDDLLLHLRNNKILLVIDNLETVIDHNIHSLVRQLPIGSKILFTARIGLGAFDFPIPLNPLSSKEATYFFRRAARVFGVPDLAGATPYVVDGYCEKLQRNPLYIKWFIQSVRAGKRPTVLTSDPKMFLQFCLQNVFNSLSIDSKLVASTLSCVNGSQSVASLAFFTDLDSISIQSALSVLITSNLISTEKGRSSEDEDRYVLSSLARLYIQKFIQPGVGEQKRLIGKQNELRSAQEEYSAKAGADVFDINNVCVRDKHDYIVAKMLTGAINSIFRGNLSNAELEITRADGLSPNYFEVHRVLALLRVAQEDYLLAEAEYEEAISLAANRAPLRLWFAGFLSRFLGDQERGLDQLMKAEELAPHSAFVKLECARVLQYHRRFDEAEARLIEIQDIDKLSSRTRRVHLDLFIQNDLRRAEYLADQHEFGRALACIEAAKRRFDNAPSALIDHRTTRHISQAKRQLPALRRAFRGLTEESRLAEIEKWLFQPGVETEISQQGVTGAFSSDATDADSGSGPAPPNRGRLSQLHPGFGFVETSPVARFYFSRSSWLGNADFLSLGDGAIVEFDIGMNEKGTCAINVRPINDVIGSDEVLFIGAIKSIYDNFGFIKLDRGGDLFFHRSDCSPDTNFRKLLIGDRVRCARGSRSDGKPRGLGVQLYSGL
jgi:LuxR family transcriptional regulator, glucitol operon activator